MAIKFIFILQKVVHDYAKVKQWNSLKKSIQPLRAY